MREHVQLAVSALLWGIAGVCVLWLVHRVDRAVDRWISRRRRRIEQGRR